MNNIPGTYILDVTLSSDFVLEMNIRSNHSPSVWNVSTNLPFDIKRVITARGQFYYYDANGEELLERWYDGDLDIKDFFNHERRTFVRFLQLISPMRNWIKI